MPLKYSIIEVHTNEEARCRNQPVHEALVQYIRSLKIAARCVVFKGIAACYENGETATQNILTLSFNMPLKVEILIPSSERERVLPEVEQMVCEGIVAVREMEILSHKTRKHLIPRQSHVKDVMTPSPKSVRPDTPVDQVVRLLLSSIFTGVPVVGSDNRPVGIITQGDLIYRAGMPLRLGLIAESSQDRIEALLQPLSSQRAEEIMTQPPVCVGAEELLTKAVNLMIDKEVKRLPVVNAAGRLVGMLSRLDVFRTITDASPDWEAIRRQNVIIGNLRFVSDIMRRDIHSVLPDTPVEEVIRIIDTDDIQRVAVVDKAGRYLGLISDRDMLRAFSDQPSGIWEYLASRLPFIEKKRNYTKFSEKLREKTAAEVMQTDLITIRENTSIGEAIRIMTEKEIKRLPVVDPAGKLRGMVSRESLLRAGFGER
jgi:CBS domain-containing protein